MRRVLLLPTFIVAGLAVAALAAVALTSRSATRDVAVYIREVRRASALAFRMAHLAVEEEPGALAPSPSGTNILRAEAVREAVHRAVDGLGGRKVTLVLPDGLARVVLAEPPVGAPAATGVPVRAAKRRQHRAVARRP